MITIHKATIQDFDAIKTMMLQALQTDASAFSVTYEEYVTGSDDWWHRYLSDYTLGIYSHMYFARTEQNETVGMIGINFNRRKKTSHVATIVWFYVQEVFRHNGVGRQLLDHTLAVLTANESIKKVSLTVVSSQTAAIELYKKYKFEQSGVQKEEINHDGVFYDFIFMEKMLHT